MSSYELVGEGGSEMRAIQASNHINKSKRGIWEKTIRRGSEEFGAVRGNVLKFKRVQAHPLLQDSNLLTKDFACATQLGCELKALYCKLNMAVVCSKLNGER